MCATTSGVCTLRAAVQEGKAQGGEFVVEIEPGVDPVVGADALQAGYRLVGNGATVTTSSLWGVNNEPMVVEDVVFPDKVGVGGSGYFGPSPMFEARGVTFSDFETDRASVVLEGTWVGSYAQDGGTASLTGGSSLPGGVTIENGGLSLVDSTVRGNLTLDSSGSLQAMTRSTVEGWLNFWAVTDVTIENSTMGALSVDSGGGVISVVSSTIAPVGVVASAVAPAGTVSLAGSVVAGAEGSACTYGELGSTAVVVSAGWNVATDNSCNLTATGDQPDTDPLLGPLADNGGFTQTRLPVTGSPVQNAIPVGTPELCDGAIPTDQRGVARPQGSGCDVGSVEIVQGPVSPPTAPVDVTAAPGDGEIHVSWSEPLSDGGSPITSYTVSVEPGGHTTSVDDDVFEATIGGLTNGTEYVASVVAANSEGDGPAASSAPVTPQALPGQPTEVFVDPAVTVVHVAWSPPTEGGPVDHYVVDVQPGDHLVEVAADVLSTTVTGLETGVDYTVSVSAGNEVGVGSPFTVGPVLTGFSDVPADQQFFGDIAWVADNGIAMGYDDGTYRPTVPVSRQAMAAFLWRLVGEPEPGFDVPPFSDVPIGSPFATAIAWAAEEGITTGYPDGTFRPTDPITRQAMAAFLWRLAGEPSPTTGAPSFPDVPPGSPFFLPVTWMAQQGITTGFADGTFRPADLVSRQAMAAFLRRYHDEVLDPG
ncbi:MAG: S-layer homology domain-containing protein [Acidimicrobiia bacterium]|nr:S-layer homology domain-containing protein [Acidimicrobiia bacterium]